MAYTLCISSRIVLKFSYAKLTACILINFFFNIPRTTSKKMFFLSQAQRFCIFIVLFYSITLLNIVKI